MATEQVRAIKVNQNTYWLVQLSLGPDAPPFEHIEGQMFIINPRLGRAAIETEEVWDKWFKDNWTIPIPKTMILTVYDVELDIEL